MLHAGIRGIATVSAFNCHAMMCTLLSTTFIVIRPPLWNSHGPALSRSKGPEGGPCATYERIPISIAMGSNREERPKRALPQYPVPLHESAHKIPHLCETLICRRSGWLGGGRS